MAQNHKFHIHGAQFDCPQKAWEYIVSKGREARSFGLSYSISVIVTGVENEQQKAWVEKAQAHNKKVKSRVFIRFV